VLVSDESVPNVGISGSWTGKKIAFNFGAESMSILTHGGNKPPMWHLCFESPCQVHGLAPLKTTIVAVFSVRA
jgi:hypothetical protein